MAKLTILAGQTLADIAMVQFGTVEAVLDIVALNAGFTINTELVPGQVINIPDNYTGTTESRRILAYYATKPFKPATGYAPTYRITEEGDKRLTEDNHNRIV